MTAPRASRRLGDFELIKELGSGGMGTVWEAVQTSLGRRVALKLLAPHVSMSATAVQRFQREGEAGARIAHPNIVVVYQVGEEDGVHFIAQELIEGQTTLATRLQEYRGQRGLPSDYYPKVAAIFAQVADALQVAHDAGIIHRDVKPSNILLTPESQPKVADFGLAQIEDALELSRTGEFVGTPFYMSPEQAMSKNIDIDHRTDVFSLGVSLWETLALQRPFDGDTSQQVLKKIVTEDPQDPRKLRSRCPRDLAIICLKALEKAPRNRFHSMAAFAEDLRRFLANQPIQASPPSPVLRGQRWISRNWVATLILATFVFGLSLTTYLWQQSVKSRQAAVTAVESLQGMIQALAPTSTAAAPQRTRDLLASAERQVREEIESSALRSPLLASLARAQYDTGHYSHALDLWDEVLGILGSGGEARLPALLEARDARAKTLLKLGELVKAKSAWQAVLEQRKQIHGEESEGVFSTLDHLGIVEAKFGNFMEAETFFRAAHQGRGQLLGKDNLQTLATLNNLASVLQRLGRVDEAANSFEEVLEGRRRILGDNHIDTLSVLGNLGAHYATVGRLDQAATIFREVIRGQEASLGPDHPNTLLTQHNLALLLRDSNRLEESEGVARQTFTRLANSLGNSHPLTLATESLLAGILDQQGEYVQAREFHTEAVEGIRAKLGDQHQTALDIFFSFAEHLEATGEYRRALEILDLALPGHVQQYGKDHPYTLQLKANASDLGPKGLSFRAWSLVDPDRKERKTDVILGLSLIQGAIDQFLPESLCEHGGGCPLDTLAWALYANGHYAEAIAASEKALRLAPESDKADYQGFLDRIKRMVAEVDQVLDESIPR